VATFNLETARMKISVGPKLISDIRYRL